MIAIDPAFDGSSRSAIQGTAKLKLFPETKNAADLYQSRDFG